MAGLVFGERKLHPGIGIEMAIGKMMHHLPHGPTLLPVRSVELLGGESGDRRPEAAGALRDLPDPCSRSFGSDPPSKRNWPMG